MARNGLFLALAELVDEGWITDTEALKLVPDLMNGNARSIFRLAEKERVLENVPWG